MSRNSGSPRNTFGVGGANDPLEERRGEQDVTVGQDHVVPPELGSSRPEREPRPLLEVGIDDVAERHAPVGSAQRGPDHVLPVADDQKGLVDTGGLEAVQQAREETPPAELDQPLGTLFGEGSEPLPQARREDEPGHGFLPFGAAPSSNWSSSCFVLRRCIRSLNPDCWMIRLNWDR